MKYLVVLSLLIASASAFASSTVEETISSANRKPESFDGTRIMAGAKKIMFMQAIVPIATPEQFEAAMQAVRKEMLVRGAREAKEASEDGTPWLVMDHSPKSKDVLENYEVVEVLKTHKRNYSTMIVRTRLNAYSGKDGGWAWRSARPRYVVYVRDDGRVLALKEDNFSNVIDFFDWKQSIAEQGIKNPSALKAGGYSREAEESEATASVSAE